MAKPSQNKINSLETCPDGDWGWWPLLLGIVVILLVIALG